jgi:hypothetical protein
MIYDTPTGCKEKELGYHYYAPMGLLAATPLADITPMPLTPLLSCHLTEEAL